VGGGDEANARRTEVTERRVLVCRRARSDMLRGDAISIERRGIYKMPTLQKTPC
jgi:hypothetical protein